MGFRDTPTKPCSLRPNFHQAVRNIECIFTFFNKSLPPDIDIRIRRGIIEVPIRQPTIRPIIPVTTKNRESAFYIPLLLKPCGETPKPPKERSLRAAPRQRYPHKKRKY